MPQGARIWASKRLLHYTPWQILQLVTTEKNRCGFAVVHKFFMLPQRGKALNSPFGAASVRVWSPGDNTTLVCIYFMLAPLREAM